MYNGNEPKDMACGTGREPVVARELNKVLSNFCEIESGIEVLRGKLRPVLAPEVPLATATSNGIEKREVMPPLAEALDGLNSRIFEITMQIRDLVSRSEV